MGWRCGVGVGVGWRRGGITTVGIGPDPGVDDDDPGLLLGDGRDLVLGNDELAAVGEAGLLAAELPERDDLVRLERAAEALLVLLIQRRGLGGEKVLRPLPRRDVDGERVGQELLDPAAEAPADGGVLVVGPVRELALLWQAVQVGEVAGELDALAKGLWQHAGGHEQLHEEREAIVVGLVVGVPELVAHRRRERVEHLARAVFVEALHEHVECREVDVARAHRLRQRSGRIGLLVLLIEAPHRDAVEERRRVRLGQAAQRDDPEQQDALRRRLRVQPGHLQERRAVRDVFGDDVEQAAAQQVRRDEARRIERVVHVAAPHGLLQQRVDLADRVVAAQRRAAQVGHDLGVRI